LGGQIGERSHDQLNLAIDRDTRRNFDRSKELSSMIGTITANSVAAMPLQSSSIRATEPRMRSQNADIDMVFIAPPR
jgi:hypothetical protein